MVKKATKKATTRTAKTPARPAKGQATPAESSSMRETILKAIEDSGRSVRSIALDAGISQPQLSRFVNGERDLLLEAVDKVVRCLGLRLVKDDSTV